MVLPRSASACATEWDGSSVWIRPCSSTRSAAGPVAAAPASDAALAASAAAHAVSAATVIACDRVRFILIIDSSRPVSASGPLALASDDALLDELAHPVRGSPAPVPSSQIN